ncbi:MAG: NAD(P)H-dependent glycerol-3-phosphate dehydrogenase [Candidatus Magasanikbacteria bacterium]|nr:NAD(P)H-dependent glycerol-3-phosphate dehydrogenase [Candidatus Magasanikbacteria bacterium]
MKRGKKQIAVLGAGNMGTAIAQVLADNGHTVRIWNWEGDREPLEQIQTFHENKKYLKGIILSKKIIPEFAIADALEDADFVFLAIPSCVLEHTIGFATRNIPNEAIIVNTSKGICPETLRPMSSVLSAHLNTLQHNNFVTISGPAVAMQMAEKRFTAMNIVSKNADAVRSVQTVLGNSYIKLFPLTDIVGVEVGGTFKNAYAIAMGICDGMQLGSNAKAALLTFSLHELNVLIHAMGGKNGTAYELAGLGDLIGTSFAETGRNRSFGEYLGRGLTTDEAKEKISQTIEGLSAVHCLIQLVRTYHIDAPFAHAIYHAVENKHDPRVGFKRFLENLEC